MKRLFIFALACFTASCTVTQKVESLPDAELNKPYFIEFNVANQATYPNHFVVGDLCKKALLPTTETPTQVFGCFRPNHSRFYPNAPLNPPRIPHNQASGPPFRRQQAHLAC